MTILHGLLLDLVPIDDHYREEKMVQHWNNESRVWATMGDREPVTRAQVKRITEERSQEREQGYTGVHFMMRARDGVSIGTIGLGWVDEWNRYAWVGAWIGEEDYWGGGHGTDALLLLTEYAFDWLDLRRLILMTMDLNARAQRNVEKAGFKLEGRPRAATVVDGRRIDGLMYGMLRREWRGRAALVEELGLRERAIERYGELVEPSE